MNDVIREIIKRPHPALVHFLITLYPVSALFAIIYHLQGNATFLHVSYWCFILATVFILPVGLTGFMDFARLKAHSQKAHRLLMYHLSNGVAIAVLGLIAGLFFWARPPMVAYGHLNLYTLSTIVLSFMVMAQGVIAALMIYQHKLGVDGETR